MQEGQPGRARDALVVEPHAGHALLAADDDTVRERRFLDLLPVVPGRLFVLVSARAHREPRLGPALPGLLGTVLPAGVESVWLAVEGGTVDPSDLSRLAQDLGADVLVPDGPLAALPGSGTYVGPTTGGTGWQRYRSDLPPWTFSTRFPPPPWEQSFPARAVSVDGVVAEPVPAGLAVRAEVGPAATLRDPAFRVAVDPRYPKLVVGASVTPAAVASVLDRLPAGVRHRTVLVPVAPDTAGQGWLTDAVHRLGRPFVLATGVQYPGPLGEQRTGALGPDGAVAFHPYATVLRQHGPGGGQEVLDVAPAPDGWVRDGRRTYRPADDAPDAPWAGTVADVVPAGLVLRAASTGAGGGAAPFRPQGWTLRVGAPGEQVGPAVVAAAELLLTRLGEKQRRTAELRLPAEGPEVDALRRLAADLGVPVRTGARGTAAPVPSRRAAAGPAAGAVAPPRAVPPVVTTSAAPVSTVSSPPVPPSPPVPDPPVPDPSTRPSAGPDVPQPDVPQPDVPQPDVPQPDVPQPDVPQPDVPDPDAPTPDVPERAAPEPLPSGPSPAVPPPGGPVPAPPVPGPDAGTRDGTRPGRGPAGPGRGVVAVPERPSTTAERNRFAAAAGESFTEALATVNAALATWPSLRQGDDSSSAKSDFVAVCLFLGSGAAGARALNAALRAGRSGPVDGQLECLVSGIRRLPTHRRPVLRQAAVGDPRSDDSPSGGARSGEALARQDAVGRVWTDPGFLTATVDLDVAVPGAAVDVLIWPVTARRTSELLRGGPVDEVLFGAGARFKALAVRTTDAAPGTEPDLPAAPRVAVLVRELATDETAAEGLDERDRIVLARLDDVLARRHRAQLRLLEEPETVERLTSSLTESLTGPSTEAAPAASTGAAWGTGQPTGAVSVPT